MSEKVVMNANLPGTAKYMAKTFAREMARAGCEWANMTMYVDGDGKLDVTVRFTDIEGDIKIWKEGTR